MSSLLKGKKCLITGASRGVGAAIAIAYAQQEATLFLAARSIDQLNELAKECKTNGAEDVNVFEVDFTKSAEVQKLCDDLLSKHDGVDVLVNNAGVLDHLKDNLLSGSPDDWDACISVNLHAPMRLTRMLAPKMVEKKDGAVVFICSIMALEGTSYYPAYTASKFGLRGWALSAYESLRKEGVKVMAIHPGLIDTAMPAKELADVYPKEDRHKPEDIAAVSLLPFQTSAGCCPVEVVLRNPKISL